MNHENEFESQGTSPPAAGRPSGSRSVEPWGEQMHVLREGVSLAGSTVRLTLEPGSYQGARTYYTVAVLQADGRRQRVARYTPFLDRAEFLCEQFCQDITDPRLLGERPIPPMLQRVVWTVMP